MKHTIVSVCIRVIWINKLISNFKYFFVFFVAFFENQNFFITILFFQFFEQRFLSKYFFCLLAFSSRWHRKMKHSRTQVLLTIVVVVVTLAACLAVSEARRSRFSKRKFNPDTKIRLRPRLGIKSRTTADLCAKFSYFDQKVRCKIYFNNKQ